MRKVRLMVALALASALVAGTACGDGEEAGPVETPAPTAAATAPAAEGAAIVVEGAWARTSPMGHGMGETMAPSRGAAYLVIRNTGTEDDVLLGASSDVAATTEIHESYMEGDTMMMRPVERIEVPAGGEVVLEPGGYHVMFIDLKEPLVAGATVEVTLRFEKAGAVTVEAEVREQ